MISNGYRSRISGRGHVGRNSPVAWTVFAEHGLRTAAIFLTAGCLAIVGGGCVDRESQAQAKRTEAQIKDPTVPVTLSPVRRETLRETLTITGQLTTAADTAVGAKVGGRLVAVHVQDGDRVSAGQLIAEQDASIPRAQVQQAEAQAAAARAALSQALTNAKIAPERSAAAVATAEAQLRAARAQLEKARAGAREEEIAQARAQANAAKSALETTKKELERVKKLHEEGVVSKQRLEAAENAYQSALAGYESALENLRMRQSWTRPEDLAAAEEQVRQAEEALRNAKAQQRLDALLEQQVDQASANLRAAVAALEMARQSLADTQLRSPFAGRIFGRPAQPGTYLNPGMPAARVIGEFGVYLEGDAPETTVARIPIGVAVTVTLDAIPGKPASGRIVSVSPASADVARIYKVRIALDSVPPGAKPGMFASGEIVLRTVSGATVVPQKAVVREGDESYVYVVEVGKAKRVRVSTGLVKDGLVQVEGIAVGKEVVVDGARDLVEGQAVRVVEERENRAPPA